MNKLCLIGAIFLAGFIMAVLGTIYKLEKTIALQREELARLYIENNLSAIELNKVNKKLTMQNEQLLSLQSEAVEKYDKAKVELQKLGKNYLETKDRLKTLLDAEPSCENELEQINKQLHEFLGAPS